MPIYDYTCTDCGHVTEVIHGINDDGPRFCPACGAEGVMRKGFATPAVHFKGSGWARKDRSSSGAGSPKPKSETAAGSDGASDGTGKAEKSAGSTPTSAASED